MNKIRFLAAVLLSSLALTAHAATDWSTQDYDLYPGDFNGDGKTDLLYIAKDVSKPSGIALSDGNGPNIPFQSWASNYLGIPWGGNTYKAIVEDFNGDGRSDVFMQRNSPGDHYVILANTEGKFLGINQTLSDGGVWSAEQHTIVAGDISGDGKADLFLQATKPGITNYFVPASDGGMLGFGTQLWSDNNYLGLKWSKQDAFVYVGDFNGDGRKDLLLQARPKFIQIDSDGIAVPIPTYPPNLNAVILSQGGGNPFQQAGVRAFSRNAFGVDFSPLTSTVVVGDFNGDGRDDIVLQARNTGRTSFLLNGNASGAIFANGTALANNVGLSADSVRLVAGNFNGVGGAGLYLQALSPAGTNAVANTITGGSIATTTHNPSSATGIVPATAVGHTVGSFAVTNAGAATYSIPITVPPGVAGVQPQLAIAYQSGGGNGPLGVGWDLAGLSEITRCSKTLAQDNTIAAPALTTSDALCLDGNKLRLTGGTYGQAGSTYQTELETFARVTAFSTAGNGPAYFKVEAKDGLTFEYGSTIDSRIEAVNAAANTTPHTWALNKVSDRSGNTMTVTYQKDGAPNGSFRPVSINYTSNATAGLASAYAVNFVWTTRPANDVVSEYVAGALIKDIYRLNRIETRYNSQLVRRYQLSYTTSSSTSRSRLNAIQECDRNGSCLSPTNFSWQEGERGWSPAEIVAGNDPSASTESSYAIDFDGDGRDDLIYPQAGKWWFMRTTSAGVFGTPVNTNIDATNTVGLPIDYFSEGRMSLLISPSGSSTRQLLRWNGTTLALTNTNLTVAFDGRQWVGDFDGDGRPDFLYATNVLNSGNQSRTCYIHVQRNVGGAGVGQFGAAQQVYTTTTSTNFNSFTVNQTPQYSQPLVDWVTRLMDFNGDGRTDFLYYENGGFGSVTLTIVLSTGSSFVVAATLPGSGSPIVGDFNGDGLTDLIRNGSPNPLVYYGSGSGLAAGVPFSVPGDQGLSYALLGGTAFSEDYDGDGRADLIYNDVNYTKKWHAARWNGNGFDIPVALVAPSGTVALTAMRLLDLDGDGQRDLGYKNGQFRVLRHHGVVPDLLNSVTDGFGNNVTVTYAPLTDTSVYTRGVGSVFPIVDLQIPAQVVKQFSVSDGIGGSYTVSQRYSTLRAHAQGRGLLGFASRTVTDSRTGLSSTLNFRQDFPYIGQVSSATTRQSDSTVVTQASTTYADLVTNSTAYADRHFPYPSTTTQTTYEVGGASNGQAITQVSTTTVVNSYGDPTSVTTTTTDQTGSGATFTTRTVNAYAPPDTVNWCFGVITQQQLTNTIPGPTSQTRTVQYVKDPNGQKCRTNQQIIEPGNAVLAVTTTTTAFDAFGYPTTQKVSGQDILDRITSVSYGPQGVFQVSATNAHGETATKTYDYALGVPLSATDPNDLSFSFQYDGFGRKTRTTNPDGTASVVTLYSCNANNGYCGDGVLRYYTSEQALTTAGAVISSAAKYYDAQSRLIYDQAQTSSGAMSVVATRYDNQGRVLQKSQPYFAGFPATFTTFGYDLIGRTVTQSRPISDSNAGIQTTTYGYSRLIATLMDANGKVTTKQKNAIGQVVRMTDPANGVTQYVYDPFANLLRTVDPANNQIVNTFNIRGFKLTNSDPDMGSWSYTYYPTGELKSQTDAKSQTVSFTYDKVSRPLTRVEAEGTTSWIYGTSAAAKNIGKTTAVSSPGGYSESYTYDSFGRPLQTTRTVDATSYLLTNTYNATTGQLETVTYPTSTSAVPGSRFKVQYDYAYGLLKSVKDFNTPNTVYWQEVATNASGQTIDEQYGNGLRTYSSYDSITGFLTSRTTGTSAQVQNLTYQWDRVGNLTQRRDANQNLTEDFSYDNLYRLDLSKLNGVTNLDVDYNALGNIISMTGVGTYTYHATKKHAVVSTSGGNAYSYDANGNMTSRNGSSITWTSYNLPSLINKGGNSSQFLYGSDRSRYKQIAVTAAGGPLPSGTETTIYVGSLFEKVTKPSGVIEYKHYVLAGKEPVAIKTVRSNGANDVRYLHKDHLGSIDTITNESGNVVQRLSFDAFGKRRNASSWSGLPSAGDLTSITALTRLGFTGHETLDNVDLVHMNGRVYDPSIGRFISADPFIQAPLDSQSFNRYSYVLNNPLSYVDPSGFFFKKLFRSIKKFVKRYIVPIALVAAAAVVTYVSGGQATPLSKFLLDAAASSFAGITSGRIINSGGGGGNGGGIFLPTSQGIPPPFIGAIGVGPMLPGQPVPAAAGAGANATGVLVESDIFTKIGSAAVRAWRVIVVGAEVGAAVVASTAASVGLVVIGILLPTPTASDDTIFDPKMRNEDASGESGASESESAPPLPKDFVGAQDKDARKQGNRQNSGPLDVGNGGTGDAEKDFEILTGGKSAPAPTGSSYPPGTLIGENGIVLRPARGRSGPRIDIPANGTKPHETLHY